MCQLAAIASIAQPASNMLHHPLPYLLMLLLKTISGMHVWGPMVITQSQTTLNHIKVTRPSSVHAHPFVALLLVCSRTNQVFLGLASLVHNPRNTRLWSCLEPLIGYASYMQSTMRYSFVARCLRVLLARPFKLLKTPSIPCDDIKGFNKITPI